MSIEDYKSQVEETYVNYDPTNMHSAYFLRLNDDGSNSEKGQLCGSDCTRHVLTVKSEVDQTIWVTGHTWDERGMPAKCRSEQGNTHMMSSSWTEEPMGWFYGSMELDPYQIKAGESVEIITEWNWNKPNTPKDWSVTAWGDKGPLSITHKKGM